MDQPVPVLERYRRASEQFARRLAAIAPTSGPGRRPAPWYAPPTAPSTPETWPGPIGAGEQLDTELVAWIEEHLDQIYAGLP